jgi:hypothetical protein
MSEKQAEYKINQRHLGAKSNLLINEPPLQVLPSLAVAIGLNEAMVIQQLHYWLNNPKAGVERDGYKWIFNTYDEWKENFPFWSIPTIQRIFASLEEKKVVIAAQLDQKKRDMTKFYRIDYDQLGMMEHINLIPSNTPKCDDVNKESETTSKTTPEINPWGIGNKIFSSLPVTEDDLRSEKDRAEGVRMFEKAFGITRPWPWWSNNIWTNFANWVVEQYKQDHFAFGNYIIWRAGKGRYSGAMSNVKIRQTPELFYDSWDMFKSPDQMRDEKAETTEYPTL